MKGTGLGHTQAKVFYKLRDDHADRIRGHGKHKKHHVCEPAYLSQRIAAYLCVWFCHFI